MFRSIATIVVAATIAFAAPAFAQKVGTPEEVITQQDNTKADKPDGAVIIRPATDVKCMPVLLTQEGHSATPHFLVSFKGASLDAIKECNPNATIEFRGKKIDVVQPTKNGVGVLVTYERNKGATFALPAAMTQGAAHNALCVPDKEGNTVEANLYRMAWADGLPEKISLAKIAPEFYNVKDSLVECQKLADSGKRH